MRERPENFVLNSDHPLAKGLVFANLGNPGINSCMYDSSGYGNNFTLTDYGMFPSQGWQWSTQLRRWSLNFNSVRVAQRTPSFIFNSLPIAFSAWIKPSITTDQTFFEIPSASPSASDRIRMVFFIVTTLRVALYITGNNKTETFFTGNNQVISGSWNHIAFYASIPVFIVWINGKSIINRSNYNPGNLSLDQTMRIGAYLSPTSGALEEQFSGEATDLLFFHRAISEIEVKQLANPSNVMLSGMLQPPKRKYYVIKPTTTTTYKYLILKQNNKFLSFRKF